MLFRCYLGAIQVLFRCYSGVIQVLMIIYINSGLADML